MDKHSIPLAYYLNDGEIDKTGYQQLKIRSFIKATNCFPTVHGVSIGPKAVQNIKWDSFTPSTTSNFEKTNIPVGPPPENSVFSNDSYNSDIYPKDFERIAKINELPEKKEERLCRRRILAELENMCYLESQEKIDQMRKEWVQRKEITNSRIDAELEAEKLVLEQNRSRELNAMQAHVNSSFLKKLTAGEEALRAKEATRIREAIRAKELEIENEIKILENKKMLKELDKIYCSEVEFREQYGEILKMITGFNNTKFQNSIQAENNFMKAASNEFIELIEKCKANNVTPDHVSKSYSLVSTIKKIHESISTKHEYFKKEIENETKKAQQEAELKLKQRQEEEEIQKRKLLEAKKQQEEDEKKKLQALQKADGETDRLKITIEHYLKYAKPFNKVKESLQPFITNAATKKFKSECQKAVNVPVNAIAPSSAAHMNDKLKKLTSILSGQQLMSNNKLFAPSQNPSGVEYCTYFLALKIVKQGEDLVSSQPESAFAIAAVSLALWGDFPNFGSLLVAAFHDACPYLIPMYWDKEKGMSEKDYYKKLGFRYVDEERDDINMFLKKQSGIARLYFALMVTHMPSRSTHQHPWGLWEAWRWIAMFTSLGPQAEISATILLTMLEICGFFLMRTYGKQFKKLLHLICVQYVPEVEKVSPHGSGGPVTRLKTFLENMIGNASRLQPPKGLLPPNFW